MDSMTIDRLNVLLRDELAAVATYAEALVGRSSLFSTTDLSRCQRSHEVRARMLRSKIVSLGGHPATWSDLKGTWESVIEAGAFAVDDDLAVRALEAGEDQMLRDYRAGIPKLDPQTRAFVEHNLLPAEEYTQRTLSDLVGRLH